MALSDLSVFSNYAYTAQVEVLKQQVALFNAASNNALSLTIASDNQGDYSDEVFWGRVSGLVKRRNAYGSGAVTKKVLTQLVDTMVKIAAGTPPIEINPGMLKWIKSSPEEAGAALGQQLAKDTLADMLNTGLGATKAALGGVAGMTYDATADTVKTLNFLNLNSGQAIFGDQAASLAAWVMHSKPFFDLFANQLTNTQQLFKWGDVGVVADPLGRPFIVTDSSPLLVAGTPNTYFTLGLQENALAIQQNDDEFTDNYDTANGDENILRTYQAEWTYNMGIKGFTWDKTNGGKSPSDAAILTATNWDKIVTSNKDLAGVMVKTQ